MPEWLKIAIIIVVWDVIRLFLQAIVNKKMMKSEFDEIDKALDDVEDAIEEENGFEK